MAKIRITKRASVPPAANMATAVSSLMPGAVSVRRVRLPSKLLTVEQAALLFNKSTKTVLRWVKAGKLKAYKPCRHWMIPVEAIEELLAARQNWQPVDVS